MRALIRHLLQATIVALVLLFAAPAAAMGPIQIPVPSIFQVPVGGPFAAPALPGLPTRPTPMPYLVG
jgi:hypothetical protein